jgi:hemoglobin/transferrin/lactoferrin receptor protein
MRRFLLLSALFILFFSNIHSQQLLVRDVTNFQPIYNVAIYNIEQTKTALTNEDGYADMSSFNQDDVLYFQHPSYQELTLAYSALESINFKVDLSRSTVNLSEVVVSASKWEQKREEVPNKITTIDVKEVAYLSSQTTADLLGNTGEVYIQKSQLGGGSPMIRGFSANSVLLVVDGVRMNNAIYRSGNLQNIISLDPNIIESAEVIFGPGSIIYGSDALGGVMDFHTQKIIYSKDNESLIKGNALLRYSTANNEKTGHFDIIYGRKNWGFVTSVSYSDFDDLRMGAVKHDDYQRFHYAQRVGNQDSMMVNSDRDVQKFSGYNQLNLMQKFGVRLSDNAELIYGFHYSTTSDVPRYDRLIQYNDDQLKYAEWYYGPQVWMMHNVSLQLSSNTTFYNNARFSFAYQFVEESRHSRKFNKDDKSSRTENLDVFNLNFDLDKKISEKSTLFYGLESSYNYVLSSAYTENILTGERGAESTRYPDGGSDYLTTALYANFKSNLNSKTTLQLGMRYSYVWAESRFETNIYDFEFDQIKLNTGALNGSVGLVYRPTSKLNFNLNISSGFRAPNIDDIAKIFDSEPGSVVVPNEELKPEYVYNVDLGLSKKIGTHVRIEATGFYSYITDLMDRRDFSINGQDSIMYDGELSKVQAIQNVTSGWIVGGSMAFLADITQSIGFKATANLMTGEDKMGDPIRHVSPFFGTVGFIYSAKKIKIDAYANFNGAIKNENMNSGELGKPDLYTLDANGNLYSPGWYTINLKGYYQITKLLQLNLGLENLLNHRYRPYSSGIVAPGRNFIIALRAKI